MGVFNRPSSPVSFAAQAFAGPTSRPGTIPASTRIANYVGGVWVAAARAAGMTWQDAGKTTLATIATDPVRVIRDPYSTAEFSCVDDPTRATLATDGSGRWWLQNLTGASVYIATLGGGSLPLVANGCCSFGRASATPAAGDSISAFVGGGTDGVGAYLAGAGAKEWQALLGGVGFGAGTGVVEAGLWKTVGTDFDGAASVNLFVTDPATAVNTTASAILAPANTLFFEVAGWNVGLACYARQVTAPQRAMIFADLNALAVN